MKKLLIILLTIGSLSSFASEYLLRAVPTGVMATSCLDKKDCKISYNLKIKSRSEHSGRIFKVVFQDYSEYTRIMLDTLKHAERMNKQVEIKINSNANRFFNFDDSSGLLYVNQIDQLIIIN